jgi:hypothetical protein
MIRLVDLLKLQGVTLEDENYKIHLATTEVESSPFDAYLAGTFKEWQEDQTKKNFECKVVLSLIHRGGDRWLFAGVYRVNGVQPGQTTAFKYETQLLPGHEELIGRVVVKYKREYRASYVWGNKYGAELEVAEILDSALSIERFPGYNNIRILHSKLVLLVSKEEPSWRSALSSVGGVYLITDILTGKIYVGSASGEGGLWQRWRAYAETGHGGTAELKDLLERQGEHYRGNFQYSVLEITDPQAQIDLICARENHWKEILMSRIPFGYNAN